MGFKGTQNLPPLARFWLQVRKEVNGCWIWVGSGNTYGVIRVNNRPVKAHRFSWELHEGPIPNGLRVLHNCPDGDNPRCVNPNHLFLGTDNDNIKDMVKKGRSTRGERNCKAKLTEQEVLEIRSRFTPKKKKGSGAASVLAREFGITRSQISFITSGRQWKHLENAIPRIGEALPPLPAKAPERKPLKV